MRIAVVGAGSMVGSTLRRQLGARHSIVAVGRRQSDELRLDLSASYTRPANLDAWDALIHCAASFGGDGLEQAVQNEMINAVGALRVAELARDAHCKHIVYISSISALAENATRTSYGLSKQHGEECLRWACRQAQIALTVLQPSQLYDEFGEGRKHQRLLYDIIDSARAGRTFTLFGSKDPLRNYLFVDDLVRVIESALNNAIEGTFPVVHQTSHRVSDVAAIAQEIFRRGGTVVQRTDMPDLAEVFFPEDHRIYECTGAWPLVDLRHGIRLIAWRADAAAETVSSAG